VDRGSTSTDLQRNKSSPRNKGRVKSKTDKHNNVVAETTLLENKG
jgi:hypothetical protein